MFRFASKSNAWIQSCWLKLRISLLLLAPWILFIFVLQRCHFVSIASLSVIWSWLINSHDGTFLSITHFPLIVVIIVTYSLLETKELLEGNLIVVIWYAWVGCLVLVIGGYFLQLKRLMLVERSERIIYSQLQIIQIVHTHTSCFILTL